MIKNYRKLINFGYLKLSNDALTSVITTVAVIAIIMGFVIGPYFIIIIPNQIERNESFHLKDVEEEFMDLRASVYNQVDQGGSDTVHSTSIKLGTENQDLFVTGGDGELDIDPSESLFSIHEYYDQLSIYARGSGQIRYKSRNFYHPNKQFVYEGGAIISEQRKILNMEGIPDFVIDKNIESKSIGLDAKFGRLTGAMNYIENIYLINTFSPPTTITQARITWEGGNGTFMTRLDIGGGPIEWSGSAASGVLVNFTNNFVMNIGIRNIRLRFNADMDDSRITIELFTSTNNRLSDTLPNNNLDTISNCYDIEVPSQNAKKFKFRNTCARPVTIKNIAVSWNGTATLRRIHIANHGGDVWSEPLPGADSPIMINVTRTALLQSNEETFVTLYFNGIIDDQPLDIKFFSENSTNIATSSFPVSLNESYVNVSLSALTLVTEEGDRIHTAGKVTKIIRTKLISSETNKYTWEDGEMLVLNFTTKYGDAWFEYLNYTLTSQNNLVWDSDGIGSLYGDYFITETEITDEIYNINLVLNSVNRLDCVIGVVRMELS
jgi:hypothetical protein